MRLKLTIKILTAAIILAVLASACGRAPNGEETPEVVSVQIGKARVFSRQGDYRQAVEMYQKALVLEPDNADIYLQLGVIYDDNLKDKQLAAAYYREFLRRDPDSEMEDRVRGWLAKAISPVPEEPVLTPAEEISPKRIAPAAAVPSPPPPARSRPTAIPPSRPAAGPSDDTYTVRGGDTLVKIAREHYGDPNAWDRIYQANRDQLATPHALKVGQSLVIPR
ncbi:MAG: tetratricopeptide repeat protein [Candidatus Erginobacter occultus]|nr:tetratricopeptide repeat protein [Candidatus Erginobacter occultus]